MENSMSCQQRIRCQPQSSRCLQRCGGGASSVTAANLKNHSKPSNTTNTKIGKRHSEVVTIKEAKAKVKPKPIVQADRAANLIQEHRQKRVKSSNNHTKNFFDKYLKCAYDLSTPEGVRKLEAHFFPPSEEPQQSEQRKQLQQQQPEKLQPGKMPKPQQLTNKPRNHTYSHKEDPIEYVLNQSKYFSYNLNN
ncbi:uncharacterized protein Dwil_GK27145 [Drosophila willistoni]|uniref:Uncharacterized protein n=1 Tax=Drosophila willistoni TaxID=7260 RepID=A0A0Q9WXK8_DROWI|nr:uncharacterized protein Dwil_GK27145 [Drosophila willistoni]